MKTVISQDGTSIAYDQVGQGPAVILVAGAFSYRKYPDSVQLADLLAKHLPRCCLMRACSHKKG